MATDYSFKTEKGGIRSTLPRGRGLATPPVLSPKVPYRLFPRDRDKWGPTLKKIVGNLDSDFLLEYSDSTGDFDVRAPLYLIDQPPFAWQEYERRGYPFAFPEQLDGFVDYSQASFNDRRPTSNEEFIEFKILSGFTFIIPIWSNEAREIEAFEAGVFENPADDIVLSGNCASESDLEYLKALVQEAELLNKI